MELLPKNNSMDLVSVLSSGQSIDQQKKTKAKWRLWRSKIDHILFSLNCGICAKIGLKTKTMEFYQLSSIIFV